MILLANGGCSICAIRKQGGVTLANGNKVMPDPILIGRNAEKIEALARTHGGRVLAVTPRYQTLEDLFIRLRGTYLDCH